jgi:CRP/FNR family cyclic AMP-dependent transcriptional regulator
VSAFVERILLLKKAPFFSLLRTDELRRINAYMTPVFWDSNETVFYLGDPADTMYLVVSGQIGISLDEGDQPVNFINKLGVGGCFGEMGLIDGMPRSATAVALEPTEGLALGREKLHGLLMAYPDLGFGMLRSLSIRIREMSQQMAGRKA